MPRDLLLHICCGPCSIAPIMRLAEDNFHLRGYFFNPNIQPLAEYLARREGATQCAQKLEIETIYDDDWDIAAWLARQFARDSSEKRCEACIAERISACAKKAQALGIGAFSTTLLYSRYQPHDFIKSKGAEIGARLGLEFVYRDFRAYWQEGLDLSRQWGIYRQKYCGCVFSESERYAKKLKAFQKNRAE